MYLDHFGLTEPPFKITPVTEFFFSGANRGEILDALIYAITDSEGIVKISGEVGSGKTMLCRMLLDRLPSNIRAIYLANPSLSRDELLYAIADGLGLDLEGQRVSVLLQNLNNHLVELANQGIRCVVLVDEAHAMPLDTLEELRLLYNLQVGKHKLIQIVLFGQPELDEKLEQTNMRQLKDRILHSFNMQPLSKKVIESYLMFRMRAAGYHGPDIFTPSAVNLIGKASNGLMRRVNILADKSLLAAFVENTHQIENKHVQAAIRDSELSPNKNWLQQKKLVLIGAATIAALTLIGTGWMLGNTAPKPPTDLIPHPVSPPLAASLPVATLVAPSSDISPTTPVASAAPITTNLAAVSAPASAPVTADHLNSTAANTPKPVENKNIPVPTSTAHSLLKQRLDATKALLTQAKKGSVSIQLFQAEDARPAKMERFLMRAKGLGKIAEIYLVPIKINGKDSFRVLYGSYPNSDAARTGIKQLPPRYQEAFAPTLYELESN